jgi:hypothetical protein
MKREFLCRGTLGDTYIFCSKLSTLGPDPIKIWHNTQHKYWMQEINDIYTLLPNVDVKFSDYLRVGVEEITSNVHEQNMDFFPEWKWPKHSNYTLISEPYMVIQPQAGKPKGYNNKELKHKMVYDAINESDIPCVILGTSSKYSHVRCKHNLTNKTSVLEAMRIVSNAEKFMGPEGLLSFVALSHKVESHIYYKSHAAVEIRIMESPWEEYCYELAYIGLF